MKDMKKLMQKFKYLTKEILLSLRVLKVSIVSDSSLCNRSFWSKVCLNGHWALLHSSFSCPPGLVSGHSWSHAPLLSGNWAVFSNLTSSVDKTMFVYCGRGTADVPSHAVYRHIYYLMKCIIASNILDARTVSPLPGAALISRRRNPLTCWLFDPARRPEWPTEVAVEGIRTHAICQEFLNTKFWWTLSFMVTIVKI